MSDALPSEASLDAEAAPESAKRKQILDGARRTFFAHGFDAASMGEIAREAGVSKGTLYVYFDSKEALFSALLAESKRDSAERLTELEHEDDDVGTVLTRFAVALMTKLVTPQHIAMVRMVIAASEKFPSLARSFFEAGPAFGASRLKTYLERQVQRGALEIEDPEMAAWQFMGMCNHPTLIGVLLGASEPPDEAHKQGFAETAVRTFLAAYAARTHS